MTLPRVRLVLLCLPFAFHLRSHSPRCALPVLSKWCTKSVCMKQQKQCDTHPIYLCWWFPTQEIRFSWQTVSSPFFFLIQSCQSFHKCIGNCLALVVRVRWLWGEFEAALKVELCFSCELVQCASGLKCAFSTQRFPVRERERAAVWWEDPLFTASICGRHWCRSTCKLPPWQFNH